MLCEESPARVHELETLGVTFDADRHGNLALGLEGGHSVRRIVHAGGAATGRRITRELSARAATHERIQVLEPAAAVALWTHDGRCVGLLARRRDGAELPVLTRATVLATGGMAALWERTTNPRGRGRAPDWAWPRPPAPGSPTSSSCSSTPPRCAPAACATAS